MDKLKKKNKTPKLIQFLIGYSLGFFSWLVGFHCLVVDPQGRISLSVKKMRLHLFKVFMWTLELGLLFNLMALYRAWLLGATTLEIEMAFVVKSVIFLYIKVFWPRVFPEILPGMHVFFCPQCYQKQTFRFTPVSFQFGFFVTYLCKYCSCLVNGWGEQIFYPGNVSFKKITPSLVKTIPAVALAMGLGILTFQVIWGLF
jgi:hypothetical protein